MRLGALVLACAACGRLGFDATSSDGGAGDAAVRPDAAPGVITVIVLDDEAGQPVEGAYVLFDDSTAGTTTVQTDAAGTASHLVGGATTVHAYIEGTTWKLATATSVGGGSTVRFGGDDNGTPTPPASMRVDLTAFAGAARHDVVAIGCGQGTEAAPPVTLTYDPACEGQSVDLLALARDNTAIERWQLQARTLVADGAVTLDGPWELPIDHVVDYSAVTYPIVAGVLMGPHAGTLVEVGAQLVVSGEGLTTIPAAGITPDRLVTSMLSLEPGSGALLCTAYPLPGPLDPDQLLAIDATLDPATGSITWSVSAPVSVITSDVTLTEAGKPDLRWEAFSSDQAATLTLPAPPAAIAGQVPGSAAVASTGSIGAWQLIGVDYDDVIGLDASALEPVAYEIGTKAVIVQLAAD